MRPSGIRTVRGHVREWTRAVQTSHPATGHRGYVLIRHRVRCHWQWCRMPWGVHFRYQCAASGYPRGWGMWRDDASHNNAESPRPIRTEGSLRPIAERIHFCRAAPDGCPSPDAIRRAVCGFSLSRRRARASGRRVSLQPAVPIPWVAPRCRIFLQSFSQSRPPQTSPRSSLSLRPADASRSRSAGRAVCGCMMHIHARRFPPRSERRRPHWIPFPGRGQWVRQTAFRSGCRACQNRIGALHRPKSCVGRGRWIRDSLCIWRYV